jgi:ribosome-binding factor A
MKETIKQRQVGTLIQKEFSTVLQNEGIYIYGDALVTVTRVRMSSDLGIAYIYLSVYNSVYKQEVIKEMWENLSRLRGELGKRIRKQVRRIPMIKFFIDDTLDQVEELNHLFDKINGDAENETKSMKEVMEERKAQEEANQEDPSED